MKTRNVYNILPPGISFLLSMVAYSTVLQSFFLSDDFELIGRVLAGNWSLTWGLGHGGFFRPLVILSYVADSTLWRTNPVGYHLTNTTLHAANSYLVYLLSTRLLRRNGHDPGVSSRISAAAGLIFLLLPSHTEAVSWISGRTDLIATLFFLASLISYDSYRRKRSTSHLALSLVLFMLALLAKESALCLPLVILVVELTPADDERRAVDLRQAMRVGGLFALTGLVYLLIRNAALGTFIGAYGPGHHLNFKISLIWERLPKYLVRSLLPPLPVQFSFMLLKPFKSRAFITIAIVCTGFLSTLLILRHKWEPPAKRKQQNVVLFLLLISFLCSLLPVITMGISVFDTSGERFVYLPSIFTSIAIAYICVTMFSKGRIWIPSILCLLIFYSATLHRSNQRWKEAANLSHSILNDLSGVSFYDDFLIVNVPDSLRGVPVYQNGLEQALKMFQRTRKVNSVDIVSAHSLQSTTDATVSVREDKLFQIRLLNEKDEFSRINDQIECVGAGERSKNSLLIELKDCFQGRDVFFFHEDKMVKASAVQQ